MHLPEAIQQVVSAGTSTMPKVSMASEFYVLDGIADKEARHGPIICMLDRKLQLRENFVVLLLEYL